MVSAYGFLLWFVQPPQVERDVIIRAPVYVQPETPADAISTEPEDEAPQANTLLLPGMAHTAEHTWRDNVFSILIVGEDDGYGGPDVIMVALFDVNAGEVDILSIPRDTVVNVPWGLKKINSYQHLFGQLPTQHTHYIYALREGVEKLIGHRPDFWITLEMGGFVALVDAIGGVEFTVPQRMVYEDPEQDLFINLHPGPQRLNGANALDLVRFRSFPQGDITRIQVQQDFLAALSGQLLRARNILSVDELVRVFRDNVETNLSLRELIFFALEFLRLDSENIRFHAVDATIANINDSVNGISYVTLFVDPWLTLINQYLNPFPWEIEAQDLEILTRDPATGRFFTTNGAPFSDNWTQ